MFSRFAIRRDEISNALVSKRYNAVEPLDAERGTSGASLFPLAWETLGVALHSSLEGNKNNRAVYHTVFTRDS